MRLAMRIAAEFEVSRGLERVWRGLTGTNFSLALGKATLRTCLPRRKPPCSRAAWKPQIRSWIWPCQPKVTSRSTFVGARRTLPLFHAGSQVRSPRAQPSGLAGSLGLASTNERLTSRWVRRMRWAVGVVVVTHSPLRSGLPSSQTAACWQAEASNENARRQEGRKSMGPRHGQGCR